MVYRTGTMKLTGIDYFPYIGLVFVYFNNEIGLKLICPEGLNNIAFSRCNKLERLSPSLTFTLVFYLYAKSWSLPMWNSLNNYIKGVIQGLTCKY
jgi:hypothetical protein